jgi:hypothetical protein
MSALLIAAAEIEVQLLGDATSAQPQTSGKKLLTVYYWALGAVRVSGVGLPACVCSYEEHRLLLATRYSLLATPAACTAYLSGLKAA